jgi:hypothetical protein
MLDDLITFGSCNGPQINVDLFGQLEFFKDFRITGGGAFFINNAGGAVYTGGAITATVSNNITYTTDVVVGQFPGWTNLRQVTWSLDGNTVTAKKYDIGSNHVLTGSDKIPGTTPGSVSTGGQAL